jgi:hypothetical protein
MPQRRTDDGWTFHPARPARGAGEGITGATARDAAGPGRRQSGVRMTATRRRPGSRRNRPDYRRLEIGAAIDGIRGDRRIFHDRDPPQLQSGAEPPIAGFTRQAAGRRCPQGRVAPARQTGMPAREGQALGVGRAEQSASCQWLTLARLHRDEGDLTLNRLVVNLSGAPFVASTTPRFIRKAASPTLAAMARPGSARSQAIIPAAPSRCPR